jgi:hypothetical protein
MELQRLCDVEGGKSVAERIGDAVKGMEAGERLRMVMDLVRMALDAEETAQEVAAEAWEMVNVRIRKTGIVDKKLQFRNEKLHGYC